MDTDTDTPSNGYGPEVGAAVAPLPEVEQELPSTGARPAGPTLFLERFEQLLPTIQKEWPQVAHHTLEATRGSLDKVVDVIARQTGRTSEGVKAQLMDLVHATLDAFERDFINRLEVLGADLKEQINVEGQVVRAQWKANHERMDELEEMITKERADRIKYHDDNLNPIRAQVKSI